MVFELIQFKTEQYILYFLPIHACRIRPVSCLREIRVLKK